jgi:hypothetical protein
MREIMREIIRPPCQKSKKKSKISDLGPKFFFSRNLHGLSICGHLGRTKIDKILNFGVETKDSCLSFG